MFGEDAGRDEMDFFERLAQQTPDQVAHTSSFRRIGADRRRG